MSRKGCWVCSMAGLCNSVLTSYGVDAILYYCQVIDTFSDSVMSVVLTKTEIVAGSVDGTVRTFDIRNGRYLVMVFI